MTSDTSTVARGRPRSEDRTTAILDTTLDLLHTEGYDNLRMCDVAERAAVGLATIYRRFETKQDLVAAALSCKRPPAMEPSGDVRSDLRALLVWMAGEMGTNGEYIAGLAVAAHEHEVIAAAIRDSVRETMRATLGSLLIEALGDRPEIDTLVDAIPGLIMLRTGLLGHVLDPGAFADEVLALVDAIG